MSSLKNVIIPDEVIILGEFLIASITDSFETALAILGVCSVSGFVDLDVETSEIIKNCI